MWSFRLNQEMKVSATAHFVTLTYSDEHLPYLDKETGEFERGYSLFKKQTLYYPDVQLYLKRLRKLEHKNHYIKFFCAGETGTQNDRVHWHLIIFNASEKNIRKAWLEQGIVDCGKAEGGSITYILKYLTKDDGNDYLLRMSKGLGKNFLTPQQITNLKKTKNPYLVSFNGTKIPIPRYYKDKVHTDQWSKDLIKFKAMQHLNKTLTVPDEYINQQIHIFEQKKQQYNRKK